MQHKVKPTKINLKIRATNMTMRVQTYFLIKCLCGTFKCHKSIVTHPHFEKRGGNV